MLHGSAADKPVAWRHGMLCEGHERQTVASFSTWLASLSAATFGDDSSDWVEIPGQYAEAESAGRPPLPERHVRLAGVGSHVHILSSKERPVRLTLRGGDGRESQFLLKGGDDLRQDARVQRFFRACNAAFAAHAPAAARGLEVSTFHVEPLSPNVGLVSWIPRANVLLEYYVGGMGQGGKDACYLEYEAWVALKAGGSGASNHAALMRNASNPSPGECAAALRAIYATQDAARPFPMRDALLRRSGSPEAFLAARARFQATLLGGAAACFVAGVGDRHPSNMMVDSDGRLFHIDFGICFGAGALLSIPELVPVRLTRFLTQAVAPLDSTGGLLRADLGEALQALQLARAPLLAALEAFVREPLLDWETSAYSHFGRTDDAPAKMRALRMAGVRAKLGCGNPGTILLREMEPNVALRDRGSSLFPIPAGNAAHAAYHDRLMGALTEIVMGGRRREPVLGSAAEQAGVLLEMGADPNLLMRSWKGWRSWC